LPEKLKKISTNDVPVNISPEIIVNEGFDNAPPTKSKIVATIKTTDI
jgi:hypothetical protein